MFIIEGMNVWAFFRSAFQRVRVAGWSYARHKPDINNNRKFEALEITGNVNFLPLQKYTPHPFAFVTIAII